MNVNNCYREFIAHIDKRSKVLCAEIMHGDDYGETQKTYFLCLGYSSAEYKNFLSSLDFNYNAGFGGQELFGTIWYEDGTWSSRCEYDGAEWWEHYKCPDIPQALRQTKPSTTEIVCEAI